MKFRRLSDKNNVTVLSNLQTNSFSILAVNFPEFRLRRGILNKLAKASHNFITHTKSDDVIHLLPGAKKRRRRKLIVSTLSKLYGTLTTSRERPTTRTIPTRSKVFHHVLPTSKRNIVVILSHVIEIFLSNQFHFKHGFKSISVHLIDKSSSFLETRDATENIDDVLSFSVRHTGSIDDILTTFGRLHVFMMRIAILIQPTSTTETFRHRLVTFLSMTSMQETIEQSEHKVLIIRISRLLVAYELTILVNGKINSDSLKNIFDRLQIFISSINLTFTNTVSETLKVLIHVSSKVNSTLEFLLQVILNNLQSTIPIYSTFNETFPAVVFDNRTIISTRSTGLDDTSYFSKPGRFTSNLIEHLVHIRPLVRSILSSRFSSLRVEYHILRIGNKELRFRQLIKIVLIGNSINIITFKEIISILTHVQILSTTNTISIHNLSSLAFTVHRRGKEVIHIPASNAAEHSIVINESLSVLFRRIGTKDTIEHRHVESFIIYSVNSRSSTEVSCKLSNTSLNLIMLLIQRIIQIKSVGKIRFVLSETGIRNTSTSGVCISKVRLSILHIVELHTINRLFRKSHLLILLVSLIHINVV